MAESTIYGSYSLIPLSSLEWVTRTCNEAKCNENHCTDKEQRDVSEIPQNEFKTEREPKER